MNVIQAGKMLIKARQTQAKIKKVTGTGASKSGRVIVMLNGMHDMEIEFNINSPADFASSRELIEEIKQAHTAAKKALEGKMAEGMDMDSIKDLLGAA